MTHFASTDGRRRRQRRAGGFTLIELLIVIGLIGLLMAVLLPNIAGSQEQGQVTETRARMLQLVQGVQGFERRHDFYPPDNFQSPVADFKVQAKGSANESNAGIESCLIFLHQKAEGYETFEEKLDWLGNTDGDVNDAVIPLLQGKAKREVLDAWGMPLVYVTAGSYDRAQSVRTPTGDNVKVLAWKGPEGGYLAPRTFQVISAGPDGQFNTDDDLTHPDR